MKVIKTRYSIQLAPENEFEKECLKHIANKKLTSKYEDDWDQKGNLILKFEPHPWDKD